MPYIPENVYYYQGYSENLYLFASKYGFHIHLHTASEWHFKVNFKIYYQKKYIIIV